MLADTLQHVHVSIAVLTPAVRLHPSHSALGQSQIIAAIAPHRGVELDLRLLQA